MDKELKNISEVREFISDNKVFDRRSALSIFKAKVTYFSSISDVSGIANVYVKTEGYNCEGDIEIVGDNFDSEIIHTGFKAKFQDYEYNKEEKQLIIKGNSPKMGGKYSVTLQIALCPSKNTTN